MMKLSNRNGISVDPMIFIQDEKKDKLPYYVRLLQYMAVIVGSWSTMAILAECFEIPVNTIMINAAILLTGTVFYVFFRFPGHWKIRIIPLISFCGLYGYHYHHELQNGFYILENLVIRKINEYYESRILNYIADYTAKEKDTTLLLIMVLVPVTALLAVAILQSHFLSTCTMLLLLPVVACFALGMVPAEQYMMASLIVLLFMAKTGNSYGGDKKVSLQNQVNVKAAICICTMCLALFLLMKTFVSQAEYNQVTELKKAKENMQSYLYNFSMDDIVSPDGRLQIFSRDTAAGGLSGGKLGSVGEVKYNNTEHLRFRVPEAYNFGSFYLKGFVGSFYTGKRWEEKTRAAEDSYRNLRMKLPKEKFLPVNQVGLLLEHISKGTNLAADKVWEGHPQYVFYQAAIEIDYINANKKYLYTPYFTNYNSIQNIDYLQDLYAVPKKKQSSYKFDYFYNISLADIYDNLPKKLKDYSEYERLYREYVYNVYTQLPAKGLDRLRERFPDKKLKGSSVQEKIQYISEYLNKNTSYSLSPGKVPKGKDFVEYFLYDNHIGYCSHYASAAALMLRLLGVPSRYVEGYAVPEETAGSKLKNQQTIVEYTNRGNQSIKQTRKSDRREFSVMDYNAHAWVEIYMDSCGWIPIEFTPGSGNESNHEMVKDMENIGIDMSQNETQQVTPTMVPPSPSSQAAATPTVMPDNRSDNADNLITPDTTKEGKDTFFVFFFLALVGVGLTGIVLYTFRKRKMLRISLNNNQKALYLYGEIQKVISLCRGLPGPGERLEEHRDYVKEKVTYIEGQEVDSIIEIAQRSRFGCYDISTEDLLRIEDFYVSLMDKADGQLPLVRKMYLKLLRLISML